MEAIDDLLRFTTINSVTSRVLGVPEVLSISLGGLVSLLETVHGQH